MSPWGARSFLALLAMFLASPLPAAEPPMEVAPMTDPARLTWTLTRAADGRSLLVAYTVTSTSQETLYLCDALPVPGRQSFVLGRTFINVAGGAEGELRLVRGRLKSVAPVVVPLEPGCRPLTPGQSVTGTATVPLPIQPAHYHGKAAPLVGTPTRATLEIGYVGADTTWSQLTMEDGLTLTTPSAGDEMRFLKAGPLPIP